MSIELPNTQYVLLSIPESHILLITINRPKQLNALNVEANWEMYRVIEWAEAQDSIWCIIVSKVESGKVTGTGKHAFCTGMDLVSALHARDSAASGGVMTGVNLPPTGFAGISNRGVGVRKPIIAAVNGYALGGGTEITLGCDLVVATKRSTFGLPEVKQGVVVAAGGLARLARAVSYQVASELLLTGRFFSADEAKAYGLVNEVIPADDDVVEAALVWARKIIANSPDAVFLSKQGLSFALERESMTGATTEWMQSDDAQAWREGDNLAEGLRAFANKRKPQWKNPAHGKSRL
ncbi:hypothetical protein DFQ28_010678 [Apophysomyces sp. BC1034]|nr:hypothetical protein DFQ30_002632 [Apophysomyces sp. BC1015]KAG0181444.1 hypothetical protein DFQ29_008313 [Apophysomyces sp. BC1021]KAG0191892.1 hypothetical protein DFQ28_010678 [Apophysomyces sp. BC1034]